MRLATGLLEASKVCCEAVAHATTVLLPFLLADNPTGALTHYCAWPENSHSDWARKPGEDAIRRQHELVRRMAMGRVAHRRRDQGR